MCFHWINRVVLNSGGSDSFRLYYFRLTRTRTGAAQVRCKIVCPYRLRFEEKCVGYSLHHVPICVSFGLFSQVQTSRSDDMNGAGSLVSLTG